MDSMWFPETVYEFMDSYKILDTEQVYTNGAELVPIFRMKQWFEHIDAVPVDAVPVVRCKDCWKRNDEDFCPFCLLFSDNCYTPTLPDDWFCKDGERREDG